MAVFIRSERDAFVTSEFWCSLPALVGFKAGLMAQIALRDNAESSLGPQRYSLSKRCENIEKIQQAISLK